MNQGASQDLKNINGELVVLSSRLGKVETHLGNVDSRLGKVETHLGNVDSRLGKVETRIGILEDKVVTIVRDVDDLKKDMKIVKSDVKDLKHEVHRQGLRSENRDDTLSQILDIVKIIHERQTDYTSAKDALNNHEHRISALEYTVARKLKT